MAKKDEWGEWADSYEPEEIAKMSHDSYMEQRRNDRRRKRSAKATDVLNEVGICPPLPPEIEEKRKFYADNWTQMHYDLFPRSTGIKPFGPDQIMSIERTKDIVENGGHLVIAEPRGFAKTSRTSNHALMAVLQGKIRYAIILASSVSKAKEILDMIKTELMDNERLEELYPATIKCFQALEEKSVRAKNQTYDGEFTNIGWGTDRIRFPVVPGEASSGSVIQVRPKDNVRGLSHKIKYGPESGRILRPDFFFLDDIQTDEEARNADTVRKIVDDIKKSVLFAGTHSKRINGIMCCTPICPGDVSSHFILHESWEVVHYAMVKKMPKNIDLWLNDYATILQCFDKSVRGSKKKAQLRARDFVEENYEALHEGSEVAWDWAYGWAETPQVELSALQHAMNFKIIFGDDAFNSECQCSVIQETEDVNNVKVTMEEMQVKEHPTLTRMILPLDAKYIVTHVDVNNEILTSMTVASPDVVQPHIIDYGTWPPQEGIIWQKGNIANPLWKLYPEIPRKEIGLRLYQGIKDYLTFLYQKVYVKENGAEMQNMVIAIDCNHEKENVIKAIRDLPFQVSIQPCFGKGYAAKDEPMMSKKFATTTTVYHHCVAYYNRGFNVVEVMMDINYFKKKIHEGWKMRIGHPGSITIYKPPEDHKTQHMILYRHMLAEDPVWDYFEKEDRGHYLWQQVKRQDNEFLDNFVGCLAMLSKLGAKWNEKIAMAKPVKKMDMQEYMNKQKGQ